MSSAVAVIVILGSGEYMCAFKDALCETMSSGWPQVMWLMLRKRRLKSKRISGGRKLRWSLQPLFSLQTSIPVIFYHCQRKCHSLVMVCTCEHIYMCCHKSEIHFPPTTPRATRGPSLVMQIDVWWWTVLSGDSSVLLNILFSSLCTWLGNDNWLNIAGEIWMRTVENINHI